MQDSKNISIFYRLWVNVFKAWLDLAQSTAPKDPASSPLSLSPPQMCLQSLCRPRLPSSAPALCPALRRTLERGCCVNWVSEPFVLSLSHTAVKTACLHSVRCACSFLADIPRIRGGCILATGDVSCSSLLPQPSHSSGSDVIWLSDSYWIGWDQSCAIK